MTREPVADMRAEMILPCPALDPTLRFFVDRLRFQIESIFPADSPRVAVISGHGVRLRLEAGAEGAPGILRFVSSDPAAIGDAAASLTAPNGTEIRLVAETPLTLPPLVPALVIAKAATADWAAGRAGMHYRDLIPGRLGGRWVASQILIAEGGPVPDYVHYHDIGFQMIYCRSGWVRVVYEDQGEPFRLEAGDCVLQPPRIRHRVLEASPGLEVIELGLPAVHETFGDHESLLPTGRLEPGRNFGGQRFHRHVAAAVPWRAGPALGFESQDLGFEGPTNGLARVTVTRAAGGREIDFGGHHNELGFRFVLAGSVTLVAEGAVRLELGDAVTVPAGLPHRFEEGSADLAWLEVAVAAQRI